MGFSRQEYWSGLPFSSPGDLSDPGIEPESPAFAARFFKADPPGKPICFCYLPLKKKTNGVGSQAETLCAQPSGWWQWGGDDDKPGGHDPREGRGTGRMRGGSKLSISTGCQWSLHKCIERTGGGEREREKRPGYKKAPAGTNPRISGPSSADDSGSCGQVTSDDGCR